MKRRQISPAALPTIGQPFAGGFYAGRIYFDGAEYALIDAVWSVRQLSSSKVVTCRTVANEKVGAGYDELVTGHRRAVGRIAAEMATVVRSFDSGNAACPAA